MILVRGPPPANNQNIHTTYNTNTNPIMDISNDVMETCHDAN